MSHTFSICPSCKSLNKVSIEKALASKAVCGKCQKNLALHGLVTNVSTSEFRKILRVSDKPVVVDFWASWCGPCQMYGPEFEKASLSNHNAVFLKVNTETEPDLSREFGIRGIPLTILFNQGKEVGRQSGAMDASGVMSFLQIKKP
jgi:thioredoxin 2